MKKLVCYVLTFCLLLQFSTVSVYAVESEKKTIEIYDYYEGTDKTVDLYFQNNKPYIDPNDLASLTDYVCNLQDEKIVFEKKNGLQTTKVVSIKNGTIQYGSYKDNVASMDVEGNVYIELIPTIDYLDSRLNMSPDGRLVLFSAEKTFSQLIDQVNYDLIHGGNIEDTSNALESGAAWLWLLLNGKLLSSFSTERSRRLAFSLLTEENKDTFTFNLNDAVVYFASSAADASKFLSLTTQMMDLKIYDKALEKLSKNLGSVSSYGNLGIDGISRVANIETQVDQLYVRNIENVENTLLNSEMDILNTTDDLYKELKKISDGYNKKSETMYQDAMKSLYADEGISFIVNASGDFGASLLIKAVPALDAGLSLFKIYGEISGVTDGAVSAIEQKDYTALQSKVAIKLQDYHNQIKNGETLSKKHIIDYVELARMYYHIKTAYYHMYNEYHPDPLFEDNYRQCLSIEKEIDRYGTDIYTLDIPDLNSTDLSTLNFPERKKIELSQEFKMNDFSCSIYLPQDAVLNDGKLSDGSTLSRIWNYEVPNVQELGKRTIQITIIESLQPYDGVQRTLDEYKELYKNDSNFGNVQYLGDQTRFIRIVYPYDMSENGNTTIATLDFQNINTPDLVTFYMHISIEDAPENIDNEALLFTQDLALKIAQSCTML